MSDRNTAGLSFTPKPRTDTTAGVTAGIVLALAGLALAGFAVFMQQTSEPVRNTGTTVPGVLIGYSAERSGETPGQYAEVSFDPAGGTVVARSHAPVEHASQNKIGATYKVFYDPEDPSRTYIEGIDQLTMPWPLLIGGCLSLLLGVAMLIRPPQRKEKTPRPRLR